jgi:hypothetical protein
MKTSFIIVAASFILVLLTGLNFSIPVKGAEPVEHEAGDHDHFHPPHSLHSTTGTDEQVASDPGPVNFDEPGNTTK